MVQSTAYVHGLLHDLIARIGTPEPVLSDELERVIAATVLAGWRPWVARHGWTHRLRP